MVEVQFTVQAEDREDRMWFFLELDYVPKRGDKLVLSDISEGRFADGYEVWKRRNDAIPKSYEFGDQEPRYYVNDVEWRINDWECTPTVYLRLIESYENPNNVKLLNRREVAEMLSVHPSTVDQLVKLGKLTKLRAHDKLRAVRFSQDEVKSLFKERKKL